MNLTRMARSRIAASCDRYAIALLVLILVFMILYTFFFFHEQLPLREPGADSYAHLGILRVVKDQMGLGEEVAPNMFPGLYKGNERNGINYVVMALISSLPGASDLTALYITGLFGIMLFLSGIYFLTRTLCASSRVAFLAAVFSLLICSAEFFARGSSFSFVELLAYAHYASTLAMGLMMYAIAVNIRYLRGGGWKLYVLQVILAALVFNIHLLTGMQYFLVLLILVAVYAAWERHLAKKHVMLILIIPASLLLASLWPLYHWWTIFGGGDVALAEPGEKFSSLGYFMRTTVLYLLGLPFLLKIKRERIFLLAWVFTFALVGISFLFPISMAFYWRFTYMLRIPLVIGMAMGLGMDIWLLSRWRTVAIPAILAVAAVFVGFSLWITFQRYEKIMESNGYAMVEAFSGYGEGGVGLAAYPLQGYDLMGISEYNVVTIMRGHADAEIVEERFERLEDAMFNPEARKWLDLIEEFGLTQALINRSRAFTEAAIFLSGELLERNPLYDLYTIDAAGLDTEVMPGTPDPELEQSEIVNGFTRFDHWAYFQWEGEEEMAVEAVEDTDEPGRRYLRVSSDDEEGALLFVNRGYIEVDPTRRYRITFNSRRTGGDPQVYLVLYEYDDNSPTAILSTTQKKIHKGYDEWTARSYTVGPAGDDEVDFAWNEDTGFVKIGILPCSKSIGQMELDLLEISEVR